MDTWVWIWVVLALLLGTFGFINCCTLIVVVFLCAVGFIVALKWICLPESEALWLLYQQQCNSMIRTHHDVIKKTELRLENVKEEKLDRRISGSNIIDEQIQSLMGLIVRDFVLTWYVPLSGHHVFLNNLQQSTQSTLVSLANRCKNMDWVCYLTTRFVDDITSHLRLFRQAVSATRGKSSCQEELIDAFFLKEVEKEKDVCREKVSTQADAEKDYLMDLLEILLYYVMPADDFANTPLRMAVIEILISSVIQPLVTLLSDPDVINTLIVTVCIDVPVTSELFISVIKTTNSVEELEAVRVAVVNEIANLCSQDSVSRDESAELKLRLGSLDFVLRVIDCRITRLDKGSETDSIGLPGNFDYQSLTRAKLFQLPLEAILKNSLTLDHFLHYMASVNSQHYINLYLNIEGWRVAVGERLCALELERLQNLEDTQGVVLPDVFHDHFALHDLSSHKDEAEVIYEQYLSERACPRVVLEDSIVKRLILRMRSESVSETWFDEVRSALLTCLEEGEPFLPSFRRSVWYIRLLAELDLLRDMVRSDEEDSQSVDGVSVNSVDMTDDVVSSSAPSVAAVRESVSDSCSPPSAQTTDQYWKNLSRGSSRSHSPQNLSSKCASPCHSRTPSLTLKPYNLTAKLLQTRTVREGSKSHAVYIVGVTRRDAFGLEEMWHVFRRYSEFFDFQLAICVKFPDLASEPFPSKKMLNNLATWFLEKRQKELNDWLQFLLAPPTLQSHPGLQDMVLKFLEQTSYQTVCPQNLVKRVENTLMVPIKQGVLSVSQAVKSVPDSVLTTMDEMVDGLYRKFLRPAHPKIGAISDLSFRGSLDLEGDENIPLRIILLLMDEIFDLRSKDQWFRRRIMLFLKQILKAMFGDIVNRRIIDFVAFLTAPEQVADYIKNIKESLWPNDILKSNSQERNQGMKMRSRVAARICMLASISDELKAILGSQTTSRGILSVYEAVQWPTLNRRLVYVILEGVLESLLAGNKQVTSLMRSLHSGSAKVATHNAPNTRMNRRSER